MYLIKILNEVLFIFNKILPQIFFIIEILFLTYCGPRIFVSCVYHSMGNSIFIWKIYFYLIKKNDLESPLIFILFLKGKQNKKEKP